MPRKKKPTSTADLPPGISLTAAGTYRARWRDANGNAQAQTFKRLIDAEDKLAEVRTDKRRGVYHDPALARITVTKFAGEWLAHANNLRAGGLETYRRDLDSYILPELGGVPLANLTGRRIDEFLSAELRDGTAPSTVARHYRTIHRLCEIAIQRGRLQINPCTTVSPPHVPPSEMRFLTIDQVLALADAAPAPPEGATPAEVARVGVQQRMWRAWVLVAAFGGARWSELVGLRRGQVDGSRIRIVEKLVRRDDGEWHREQPKSAAGRRTIALPAVAARALSQRLADIDEDPDTLVFSNQSGGALHQSNFRSRLFKPALELAGIPTEVRVHDMRHTAVALAIKAGAHPKAIQARMGHASISVTLDRYGPLFPEMDAEIASGIDELVAGTRTKRKAPRPAPKRGRRPARRRTLAA